MSDTRSRTITWDDPAIFAAHRHKSGLEVLQALVAGELSPPPMGRLMNIRLVDVARGYAVFEAEPGEFHYNTLGSIHGGFAATLLDSAMGCSVHSCLEAGDRYTTLDIKVTYLKALTRQAGVVRAEARIVHVGRTTALAEARMLDAAGTIYAHATSSCLIKRASPVAAE